MQACWCCVLALLFMPAEVILHTWTVSQNPSAITITGVNSSVDITCSTTIENPIGLSLQRRFYSNFKTTDVLYLAFTEGDMEKVTKAPEFEGRLQHRKSGEGWGFTLTLSLLRLDDTDLYYCSWNHIDSQTYSSETYPSNGTIIIVRETYPDKQCKEYVLDIILIALSVTAVPFVFILVIGALIFIHKRFKKKFRPARPDRPQPNYPQRRFQPYSYLTTSGNPTDFRDIC